VNAHVGLPYRFDTSYLSTLIFKAAACLEAILLLGLAVKLVAGNVRDALGIAVLLIFVGGLGLTIFRKAGGSTGTITTSEITVQPVTLFGFKTTGPKGRFPIAQFETIRLEWRPRVAAPGVHMSPGLNESVYLIGKDETPDIEIARLTDESARSFARELGRWLSLPVEERPAPGVHGTRT
jgi:hypothetical protein